MSTVDLKKKVTFDKSIIISEKESLDQQTNDNTGAQGQIRFNKDTLLFEGYHSLPNSNDGADIFGNKWRPFTQNVATLFPYGGGYAGLFYGKVVDMFYFPIITNAKYPEWMPFVGGDDFEFFRPVFNLADASISSGVIAILIFQKKFFKTVEEEKHATVETDSVVNDKTQIF